MGNRQIALTVGNTYRLCVLTRWLTRSGVTDMSDSNGARHVVQNLLIKHLINQTNIFMTLDDTVVVYRDAARFLTSVLQSKQGRYMRHVPD